MAEHSNIEWTHATFNPWRGCQKVSPGCAHCYAETLSHRNPAVLGEWGPSGKRVIAAESYWRQPLAWDRAAAKAGERRRVFCASLADVFEDRPELTVPRCRLFRLIHLTPNLDWLLLTKRPEGIMDRLLECAGQEDKDHGDGGRLGINDGACLANQWKHGSPMPNIWLGVSVEDQQRADERIPLLLQTPAAVRFLSVEPLLEPIDLTRIRIPLAGESFMARSALHGTDSLNLGKATPGRDQRVDWVIVGGESGRDARRCDLAWIRSIVRQCHDSGIACFVKQLGSCASDPENGIAGKHLAVHPDAEDLVSRKLKDSKGGDIEEFPEDLRVREFPEPVQACKL